MVIHIIQLLPLLKLVRNTVTPKKILSKVNPKRLELTLYFYNLKLKPHLYV